MSRWAFPGIVALLGLVCTTTLVRVAATLFLHVPLDPNEGWNAYHSVAAMSGGHLYPSPGGFLFNNYPPLSFYIVGTLGTLIGDHIFAGRLISFLATLAVAGGIFAALRIMRADLLPALFAALLFVAGLLVFTDYVGMDDPQLLAHAVAIGGLILLLKEPRVARFVVVAAFAMMFAGFIKHNLIALPVAMAAWLMIYDRGNAAWFVGSGIAFVLAGLTIFQLVYGIGLLGQLNSARLWSGAVFGENLTRFLLWSDVSLFGLATLLLLGRRDRYVAFCAIYAAISVVVGAAFAGGAGVDLNIWFDAAIALALGGGLLFQRLSTCAWLSVGGAFAYTIPLLAGLWLDWNSDWLTRDYWLHPFAEETASAEADIAFLKSHDGPALCEMLSLCYWAGKRAEVDVFNLGQAYASHRQSDATLIHLIEARYFRTIEFDSLEDFAMGDSVRQATARSYRVDHPGENGVFLLPR